MNFSSRPCQVGIFQKQKFENFEKIFGIFEFPNISKFIFSQYENSKLVLKIFYGLCISPGGALFWIKWQIEHWNIEQVIVMAICWTWFCFPLQKLDIYGRLESRDLIRRIRSKVESSNQTPGNEITKKSNPDHQTTNSWTHVVTRGHTPHCSTPNHHLEGGKVFQESLDFVSKWPDFPESQSSSKVHEKFITKNHEEHTVSRIWSWFEMKIESKIEKHFMVFNDTILCRASVVWVSSFVPFKIFAPETFLIQ